VKAVVESDAIDPLALAAKLAAGTPVLVKRVGLRLTRPVAQPRSHSLPPRVTPPTVVELRASTSVARRPDGNVANYSKQDPLSPQLVADSTASSASSSTRPQRNPAKTALEGRRPAGRAPGGSVVAALS